MTQASRKQAEILKQALNDGLIDKSMYNYALDDFKLAYNTISLYFETKKLMSMRWVGKQEPSYSIYGDNYNPRRKSDSHIWNEMDYPNGVHCSDDM